MDLTKIVLECSALLNVIARMARQHVVEEIILERNVVVCPNFEDRIKPKSFDSSMCGRNN